MGLARYRSPDSVEELGLAPGVSATAVVKATSVMIERETKPERVHVPRQDATHKE